MEVGSQSESAPSSLSRCRIELIVASATLAMLFLTAVMLCSRRLAGAFEYPPSVAILLTAAVALACSSILLRAPIFRVARIDRVILCLLLFGTTFTLSLIGMLLTDFAAQPWWAWLALWLAILSAESFVYLRLGPMLKLTLQSATPVDASEDDEELELPEGVCQQLVRSFDPTLGETIHGKWRARFQSGQRNESVHLSFCPPLAGSPNLEVETVSGPAASTKPSLVVPHGARIDIRLDEPAEEQTDVVLEIFVHQQ